MPGPLAASCTASRPRLDKARHLHPESGVEYNAVDALKPQDLPEAFRMAFCQTGRLDGV